MTATPDRPAATPPTPVARRSRWRRFSPSMGWTAFWSEILIVVLGVVIALAANEAMQEWSWRGKVGDGKARLLDETANVFEWSAEQYATQPCIQAQLDRLTRRLLESGDVLEPAPTYSESSSEHSSRFVVRLPYRPWHMPTWESLVADGTATRFSSQAQAYYSSLATLTDVNRDLRIESNQSTGRLLALSHPVPLDASARREFLVDIESLRRQTDAVVTRSAMLHLESAGLVPAPESVDAFLARSGTIKFCTEHGLPLRDWREYRGVDAVPAPPAPAS
jgi:hypothetical protein